MIGLIPCAGHATRLHGLPKYLLPLGDSYLLAILVRRMQAAGVAHVYIGANRENYDLVEHYAPEGCTVYLVNSKTMSETVLAARKYAGDSDVLFGMPDTWWQDETVYKKLSLVTEPSYRPVELALFGTRSDQRNKLGMCELGDYSTVTCIVDKPNRTNLTLAWGAMAWRQSFWAYINSDDPHIGYAAQRAVNASGLVGGHVMRDDYYDCGTPDEYFACIRATTGEAVAR